MIALLLLVLAVHSGVNAEEYNSPWHYKCEGGFCKKELIRSTVYAPQSLAVCQLFCGESSALWPKPTGHLSLGRTVSQLNLDGIVLLDVNSETLTGNLLERNLALLKENVRNLTRGRAKAGGVKVLVQFEGEINMNVKDVKLSLTTDESYKLYVMKSNHETVNVTITTKTYFGARNALETLSQLIVFDDLRNEIVLADDVYVKDAPVYPYRGVLLDTSRNFVDKATILRTIRAMGMSKLNSFHWHITDSHSFPYISRTWPKFSKYGAYSPEKVYTREDIKEILDYGLLYGVRIVPEFDAPAHVGEGWQWVGNDTLACFKAEPWQKYCVEPPCGQLNPVNEKIYEVLGGLYKDMTEDFQPDIFHMGGDEVNYACWNSSKMIKEALINEGWGIQESGYHKLWDFFQYRVLDKLHDANGRKPLKAVLWTSTLTNEENIRGLSNLDYIIQIWTNGTDPTIARLLKNDFQVIFSNYDALYLDCGFGAWVGEGNNWCSPYKGWQLIYQNSPLKIVQDQGCEDKKHLILGGEATLWTEQSDSVSIDSKIWPRAAAMAERLWAEPASSWIHAEQRMLRHRERLVERGVYADSLEPEWCLRNQGSCYL